MAYEIVLLPDGSLQCMNCDIIDRTALAEIDKARAKVAEQPAGGLDEIFNCVDDIDWTWLLGRMDHSGQGKFWTGRLTALRAALRKHRGLT
jgi:hypothetical protein